MTPMEQPQISFLYAPADAENQVSKVALMPLVVFHPVEQGFDRVALLLQSSKGSCGEECQGVVEGCF